MALPRSKYVREEQQGVYHCFSRCVRRAYLCGFDTVTHRDFSHRKQWLVNRLRFLASIFAIEVIAYAILEDHYHSILRTRPDLVATWSDLEVALRWLMLFPRHHDRNGNLVPTLQNEIRALADCPERIAKLRQRLSSLSWFIGRLNEYIARAANKEDGVKGRFWESRFKCQVLLDEPAIVACMVYVDLNPIRAGQARTPEESDFTSIQERILSWQKDRLRETFTDGSTSSDIKNFSDNWLCPIELSSEGTGILPISTAEYFDLVDKSGRMLRPDKRGAINANLDPILLRINAVPAAWIETISLFGSKFCLAAGLISSLRSFADRLGRKWLRGITSARAAFA